MKKTAVTALVALMIILSLFPNTALATEQQNIAIIGPTWDMPPGYIPTIDISKEKDLISGVERATDLWKNGTNIIVAGGPDGMISNPLYSSILEPYSVKNSAFLVRIGGLDRSETQRFMTSYLDSVHFFNGPGKHMHDYDNVLVGIPSDIPDMWPPLELGIDMSDSSKLQANIEDSAYSLSRGSNLVVVDGVEGPVSETTYQAIIDRANQIDPDHGGSIVRIAGKDKEQTARFLKSYLSNAVTPFEG